MGRVNYIYRDFHISYDVLISTGVTEVRCILMDAVRKAGDPNPDAEYKNDTILKFTIPYVTYNVERIINISKERIDTYYENNKK